MYWLNGVASQLSLASALRGNTATQSQDADKHFRQPLDIVSVEASPHASLFVSCTSTAVYLWSVKPTAVLSFVERSEKHIHEFGTNKHIMWKPDASAIVVMTTKNYLLLYAILSFEQRSFEFNFPHSHHAFVTGPGEGGGPRTMLLKFRLAIRVDAGVACGTSSDDTLIIATQKPAAIQCISWNPHEVNSTQTAVQSKLGIFVDPSEKVISTTYDKAMNVSIWVTSAGRVYFIQNAGASTPGQRRRSSSRRLSSPTMSSFGISPTVPSYKEMITWTGTCFHGEEEEVDVGKQATSVAVNGKFSLIAVGTKSGKVYVYSANNYVSAPTLSHEFIRQANGPADMRSTSYGTQSSIKSLAWTSDGYALAVGFESRGIAVWSVYGNLLSSISVIDDIFYSHGDGGDEPYLPQDTYIKGVSSLFWGPGNHHLFILSAPELKEKNDDYFAIESEKTSLFTLPFAKSAITSFHNADNARRGLLQMDDRILLYNYGGDYQENNTTTIDPDAVLWTQVLYPPMYITDHWPIRYASISADGKFVAVAGRRGLAHYNTFSNRWKMFGNQQQEQGFLVRGGLAWYKNILIAACEVLNAPVAGKLYELRLYSRDNNLDNAHILYTETLQHTPLYINICGNYLLVYTSDNVLNVYNIITRSESINAANAAIMNGNGNVNVARLERVRRVAFGNVVARVTRVRGISLFGSHNGDQMTALGDVISANIVILVDGKLIMLCPRVPDDDDDSDLTGQANTQSQYDLHVLSDKTEYYWIGKKSISNLLTSLWVVDGKGVKVYANLLRSDDYGFNTFSNDPFESEPSTPTTPGILAARANIGRPYSLGFHIGPEPLSPSMSVIEMDGFSRWRIPSIRQLDDSTIYIPLDFYPHSVLLEKGVVIGIEQGMVFKESLKFMIYKMSSKTHLFIHHILQHLLRQGYEEDAVVFGRAYERLIYFGHSLEILLHTVLEEETENRPHHDPILPLVIKYLDQFPHALDVIVSCARKTEVALWDHLFSVVGEPKDLFELCLSDERLRTATSYLIILQTMQPLAVGGKDTIRLLQKAMDVEDFELCKELVRFLSSIDNTGKTVQEALEVIKNRMDPNNPMSPNTEDAQVAKVVQSMQGLTST
ncbi:RIC1-domain-containing protein [Zychaea mexicana]|uniref:RIC1-domain-containing protein n=1 Tax=Zychaea mexicana TaxID=64656 RepID=UPI0022FF2E58|nr:RIC1-domain-containing protein [Zychaea mexicana]KAI9489868.1 RIC1-domain-containing protein [Zychaea mexicana]